MSVQRRRVELLEKNKPRQDRAKKTYERILCAAAELLVEVGVERISTNLIAERAQITVPALYRYFPNKYSVLHALGARLMDAQNQVLQQWFDKNTGHSSPDRMLDDIFDLLWATYEVTLSHSGGLEIIQALRAVGPLQEVRLNSHKLMANQFADSLAELLQRPKDKALELAARISIDMGYAVMEMALEDSSLSPRATLEEGARMLRLYWLDSLKL